MHFQKSIILSPARSKLNDQKLDQQGDYIREHV